MPKPRWVQVRLKTGVTHAVLPDGRSMKSGVTYAIPYDDFQKIPARMKGPQGKALDIMGVGDTGIAKNGVDLTYNDAALPTKGATGQKRRVGATEEGVERPDRYTLVKNTGASALAAGNGVVWANKDRFEVKRERNATEAKTKFAGVAIGAVAAGNYGWIQTDGYVTGITVTVGETLADGEQVALHPTGVGEFREVQAGDTPVGTYFDGDLSLRTESGRPRYVRQRGISPV